MKKALIGIFFLVSLTSNAPIETPMGYGDVFSGAYGWGSNWTFSGYTVRKVTNLNNSGAGSLREAATQANSLVVFEVAGTIGLSSGLAVANNVYIAGQTAFRYGGGGINITKAGSWGPALITTNGSVIIRYLNISGWPNAINCCSDAMRISGNNTIIDHVTFRGGSDETVDLYQATNLTIQYSIVSYALVEKDPVDPSTSNRGMLGDDLNNITFLGNLFAENSSRNPQFGGGTVQGRTEFYNNTIFATATMGFFYRDGTEGNINVVGNYVRRGKYPQPARSRFNYMISALPSTSRLYALNNIDDELRPSLSDPEIDAWSSGSGSANTVAMPSGRMTSTPHAYPLVSTYTPLSPFELREKVLNHVGNSIKRDAIDIALINEYDLDRGQGWYPFVEEPEEAFAVYNPSRAGMTGVEADSDGDGIPNSEESTWGNDTFGYVNSLVDLEPPVEPTCSDGIQNGDETGIDCGGSCPPCGVTPPVTLPSRQRKQSAAANILLFTQQKI